MKGLKNLAKASQNVISTDRATWIPVYYSIATDTVYSKPGSNRFFVTSLINPNTESDIENAVNRSLRM